MNKQLDIDNHDHEVYIFHHASPYHSIFPQPLPSLRLGPQGHGDGWCHGTSGPTGIRCGQPRQVLSGHGDFPLGNHGQQWFNYSGSC